MNTGHLLHNEDLMFVDHEQAFYNLQSLYRSIYLNSPERSSLSLKYDGIAVFIGVDPADDQYFVASKSFLNKTPKLYKSIREIKEANIKDDLKQRLYRLFVAYYYHCQFDKRIFQGDLLFIRPDLKRQDDHTYFHANTLAYFTEEEIAHKDIGVAFHTVYTGDSITNLVASPMQEKDTPQGRRAIEYSPNIKFKSDNSVWFDIEQMFMEIRNAISCIDMDILHSIKNDTKLQQFMRTFNNRFIRQGEYQVPYLKASMFISEVDSKFNVDKNVLAWCNIFSLYDKFQKTKDYLLDVTEIENVLIPHLVSKDDTITKTKHEGLVLHRDGYSVKFVNRKEFSHANFSDKYKKGWEK